MKNLFKYLVILLFVPFFAHAQDTKERKYPISFHGSIQSDILLPQNDSAIGATGYEDFALTNTYVDLNLMSQYVDVGTRFEFLQYPLPGFEPAFKGWGFPYFYVTGKYKSARLTLGDFYEQFGSGLILRTYQERSLGIDNALRGGRLYWEPYKGIALKVIGGQQRRYFDSGNNDFVFIGKVYDKDKTFVWGGDLELSLDQWITKLQETNTYLMLGGSFVGKHSPDEIITVGADKRLNLPANVGAFDVRARLQKGGFSFLGEYAMKINDPAADNGYIYKNGNVLLLSGSYSQRGLSILLQAKRSDNMSFRSRRTEMLSSSFINHLPAFTMQQTYALAALYPYATQPDGEWAFQGNFAYTFKRNTALGGKYGTGIKLNASYIRSIDKEYAEGYDHVNVTSLMGTDGYTSKFFKLGDETYYGDVNVSIDKKFTRDFKLNFMYMYQYFNQGVVQAHGDIVNSNIFILEGRYQFNKTFVLRGEAQYLNTRQDEGDWWYAMLELTILPKFMITVSDMYNSGETNLHYYKALLTFTHKSHLIQAGYGRTRAGYDCSGGICRQVPASKGFQLSYNFTF